MASRRFRVLDLFAGAGGLTRGLVQVGGFEPAGAVEFNRWAAGTYAVNFGEDHTFLGPIEDYHHVPKVDLVVGGPPCQGFSNLGKKDPEDARNRLWQEFARVVVASDAQMFVFENVARFAKTPEARLLHQATESQGPLKGFHLQQFLLNAADFGTPQKRQRTFIVGSRIGPIEAPRQTHAKGGEGGLEPWVTLRDVLYGVLPVDLGGLTALPDTHTTVLGLSLPGEFKLADLHVGRTYQADSIRRYSHIYPGGNRFLLPEELKYECWKRHKSGAGDVLGRLEWDEPSVTIRTEFNKPEKGRYLHPEWTAHGFQANRALTHAEAAVIQGFDESHTWVGTKIEIARQIGNAVPPPLARAVALPVSRRLSAG